MQRMFEELMMAIRNGKGDEEVMDYIFDVVQALAFIPELDYPGLIRHYFLEPQGLLTQNEVDQWVKLASEKAFSKAWTDKQQDWLETYAKRSSQVLLRT